MKRLLHSIENLRWDLWLVLATLALVMCGVVMVYSASLASADGWHLFIAQARYAIAGVAAMILLMHVNYQQFKNPVLIYVGLGLITVLLMAVLFFAKINGAHRWIRMGGFSLQPSELAKAALIVFLAWFLAQREEEGLLGNFGATIAPAGVIITLISFLILREPDLGTTLMIGLIFGVMVFASGMPLRHLMKLVPLTLPILILLVMRVGWRKERIMAFLNPESDPLGKGYQAMQSLIAVGSGGINGLGFGQGRQKLFFLPEPHSDFIFAVIGEEHGLLGALLVVIAYGVLLYRGLVISGKAPDRFGQLLALGITTALVAQAFFNISVNLSLLPTKGIPLPLVSAGGTSILVSLALIGVLLNVSLHKTERQRDRETERL
jgi:cell division protein FtsW